MNTKLFKNRDDASKKLLDVLPFESMQQESWIVLASSIGGVPIAKQIANKLNAQFDFIFNQKINSIKNNECEIAIITETKDIIIHEELMRSFDIKLDDIYQQANKIWNSKIQEDIEYYRNNKKIVDMKDKSILLIDEGLNTGLTMMACIKSVINCGAKSVVVGVPVLPEVTIADIESIADDLYFVDAPAHFVSIDFYYEKLPEIKQNFKKI
jgi:putative phosphoribosyl transferase